MPSFCKLCGKNLDMVGKAHNCRPRDPAPAVVAPKPKLSGGAMVKSSRGSRTADAAPAKERPTVLSAQASGPAGVAPGPRETKLRAKPGSKTYVHRDAGARRVYQRDLMRKRRAKEPA